MIEEKRATAAEKETGRVEAFSDGVFAVAITLLVFDLTKVPQAAPGATFAAPDLARALGSQWPAYIAFALSFATILIMWMNHHSMFKLVQKTDSPFMLANGFLLLLVTVVPFPTALLAEYLTEPAAPTAAAAYTGLFVVISVAYNLLWWTARRGRLLRADVSPAQIADRARTNFVGIPAYTAALACAFWNPTLSVGICALLWLFWVLATFLA